MTIERTSIQHGGDLRSAAEAAGCAPEEILDFSVNLNPLGPPEGAFSCYFRSFDFLQRYPELHAETLNRELAESVRCSPDEVLAGNGSNDLLDLAVRCSGCRRAVIATPGYLEYAAACERAGIAAAEYRLSPERDFLPDPDEIDAQLQSGDLMILGNPGNPAGVLLERAPLAALVRKRQDVNFLIDEAFIEFTGGADSLASDRFDNLAVSCSFTKFYALPGLRMGFLCAPAWWIAAVREMQGIWSVGTPAMEMMRFLLREEHREYRERSVRETARLRRAMLEGLARYGFLHPVEGRADFILLRSDRTDLCGELLRKHRILTRDCADYPGLGKGWLRLAVRPETEQEKLFAALDRLSAAPERFRPARSPTPALMLQGTCSNAGKSVLTAAFCRILLQDGFKVAPFKAQNMALNSFVTPDGGEIGRAQAVQAEACRIDPDVRMNPILLKPNSDLGSQVIELGHAVGNFKVREFYAEKPRFRETVRRAYASLATEYDVMVLEGAGSPGEVNLKKNDIVNMNMAAFAGARVLLVGDIDRGGVYASFLGTYATLTPEERHLLAGFVVNKFRGDPTLLADAHIYLRQATGVDVLGVIDFLPDLGLPEEDSVNFSFVRPAPKWTRTLDCAIVALDHIANFTDFAPFELEPDVTVRKVRKLAELGTPDLVILPGSKSVAADMAELEKQNARMVFSELRNKGCTLVGLCGGLQLLGRELLDPEGIESPRQTAPMLGLLDLTTVMRTTKTVCRTRARRFDGARLSGYELHHGESVARDASLKPQTADDGRVVGYETEGIFASYLHGVFDDDVFRRRWLDEIRVRRGLSPVGEVVAHYEIEAALDRLADHVRKRMDMDHLYELLGVR